MSRASTLAKAIGADGAIAVSGNTTLGDASTDTVTFNAATASIPNGINFSGGNFGVGKTSPATIFDILKNDTTGPTITLTSSSASGYINQWGSVGGGTGRTNRFEINASSTLLSLSGGSAVTFQVGGVGDSSEKARIDSSGNFLVGTTTALTKATVYGSGSQILSLVSPDGSSTQAGIRMSPSMTVAEAAANQAQAAIYAVDSNYSASIIFANKATGALGNSLTERMRINAGAPILCLAGGNTSATGTGIAFPATQSASSDANTLDDYEEGTWTPTFGSTGTNPTVSYVAGARTGTYVKIGRMVYIFWDVTASSISGGSGQPALTGLPFTIASSDTVMAGYGVIFHRDAGALQASTAGAQLKGYWERGAAYGVPQVDYSPTGTSSNFSTIGNPVYAGSGRWTGWGAYVAQS